MPVRQVPVNRVIGLGGVLIAVAISRDPVCAIGQIVGFLAVG